MPATATSPLPTSAWAARPRSLSLGAIVAGVSVLLAIAGFFYYGLLLPALAFSVLLITVAIFHDALQTPAPKRLIPIGMAGSLAVKLTGDSLLVGRLSCCRVEIPLPTVSSHHCRLSRVGTHWYIEDLSSRNGTFVNGRRVRKKRLHVGDKISIGEFTLRVE